MTVEVKEILYGDKVADNNGNASLELIEAIQRLVEAIRDHEARLEALEP